MSSHVQLIVQEHHFVVSVISEEADPWWLSLITVGLTASLLLFTWLLDSFVVVLFYHVIIIEALVFITSVNCVQKQSYKTVVTQEYIWSQHLFTCICPYMAYAYFQLCPSESID